MGGSKMPAKSMELKHTIALIRELDKEISEVESAIDTITSQMDSPIFTIPGIEMCIRDRVFSGFNDQNFHRNPPHQKFLSAHFSA